MTAGGMSVGLLGARGDEKLIAVAVGAAGESSPVDSLAQPHGRPAPGRRRELRRGQSILPPAKPDPPAAFVGGGILPLDRATVTVGAPVVATSDLLMVARLRTRRLSKPSKSGSCLLGFPNELINEVDTTLRR